MGRRLIPSSTNPTQYTYRTKFLLLQAILSTLVIISILCMLILAPIADKMDGLGVQNNHSSSNLGQAPLVEREIYTYMYISSGPYKDI